MAAIKEVYLKNVSEEEIIAMFKNYVPTEDYQEFIKANKDEFVKIKYGKPSKVFELSNFKTGVKYSARINGIKQISNGLNSYNIFSCFYKLPKLQLAKDITIGNYKYSFTENEINELKETRRLNQKIILVNDKNETTDRFVAIDDELNRIAFVPVKSFRAPDMIKNTKLTMEQKQQLENGEKIEFMYKRNPEDSFMIQTQLFFDPVTANIHFSNLRKLNDQKTEIHDLSNSKQINEKIETDLKSNTTGKDIEKIEKSKFTKQNQITTTTPKEKKPRTKQQTMKL